MQGVSHSASSINCKDRTTSPTTISCLSQLDALDKWLSRPIFLARLPVAVEYILSVPGNFFGVPLVTLFIAPNVMAMCFSDSPLLSTWWHVIVWFLVLVVLILWFFVLKGSKTAIQIFYGPMLGVMAALLGVALLSWMPDQSARHVGYFQLSAWCASVLPVALLKPATARIRPACQVRDIQVIAAMQAKHLHVLPRLFQRDGRASFPSGDTAGAMAVSYTIGRCGSSSDDGKQHISLAIAVLIVILSATGRMYWQAHHLADVMVGVILAIACCWSLEQALLEWYGALGSCRAHWWHALCAHAALCIMVILSRLYFKTKIFQSGTIRTDEGQKKR